VDALFSKLALGIELICANSPQAKGRVERMNLTLQDRLVKELRLRKINNMNTANVYLPEFMEAYNKQFAVVPASAENSHRLTLPKKEALDLIFSHQHERRLSKNLELSYHNVIYQVKPRGKGYNMRHATVKVCENKKKEVKLLYKNKFLTYKTIDKKNQRGKAVSAKEVNQELEKRYQGRLSSKGHKPKADHPWRRYEKVA